MRLGILVFVGLLSLSTAHGDSWWDRARDSYAKAGFPGDAAIEKGGIWRGECYRNSYKEYGVRTLIHFRRIPGKDAVNLVVLDDGKDYPEMRPETVKRLVREYNRSTTSRYSELTKGAPARQGTHEYSDQVKARQFEWGVNGRGYIIPFPGNHVGYTWVRSNSSDRYSLKAVRLESGQVGFRLLKQRTVLSPGDRYVQTFHPNDRRPPITTSGADSYVDGGVEDYCILDTFVTNEDTEAEINGGSWWEHAVDQWNNHTTWIQNIDDNLANSIWTDGFCTFQNRVNRLDQNVGLFFFEETAPGLGTRRSIAPLYSLDYSEMRVAEIRRVFNRDIRPRWSYSGYANYTEHFHLAHVTPANDTQREQVWMKGVRNAERTGWSSLWISRRAAGDDAAKELCKFTRKREE